MVSTAKRLMTGSSMRVFSLVAEVAVAFYLMPFVIHALGDRWYGIWVVIGTFIGYYGLMDFGLVHATQRFLSYAIPKNDNTELAKIFNTSLFLFFLVGILALLVTAVIAMLAPLYLSDPKELMAFQVVCVILGINAALSIPASVLPRIYEIYLRYDLMSYIQIVKMLLRTGLIIYFLSQSNSIITLALITITVNLLGYGASFLVAKRLAPWMTISRKYFRKDKIKPLLNFGVYAFIADVAQDVRLSIDTLIIAKFIDLSTVTHYNIAARLAAYFLQVVASLVSVMSPVFTQYISTNDKDNLLEKFLLTTKISVFVSTMLAGGIICLMEPFIIRWMGPAYGDAYLPLLILTCGILFEVIQIPSENLLFSMAKTKEFSIIRGCEAVLNLILSIALVHQFGMVGVAIGTLIPLMIFKLWFQPRYLCRQIDYPYTTYMLNIAKGLVPIGLLHVPLYLYIDAEAPTTYLELAGITIVFYAVATPLLFKIVFTAKQQTLLLESAPVLSRYINVKNRE